MGWKNISFKLRDEEYAKVAEGLKVVQERERLVRRRDVLLFLIRYYELRSMLREVADRFALSVVRDEFKRAGRIRG